MTAPSDPTALVAELRAGKVGPLPDGWDMGHYEEAVQRLLDRAADLIAQQAATIAAAADEIERLKILVAGSEAERYRVCGELVTRTTTAEARTTAAEAERDRLVGLLDRLVNAKAISGVRDLVAGWNGENRPDGPYPRHDARLGATLPKANCGQIYELDDAMQSARAAIGSHAGVPYRPRNLAEADKDLRHDQPDRLRPHHRRLPHAADEALSSTERAALSAKEQPDV